MYLLYLDESGQPKGHGPGSSKYFVLAGAALHEQDCDPLSRSIESLQARLLPSHPELELHATDMWAGRKEWARVPISDRRELLRAVFHHIGTWTSPRGGAPLLFAAAVEKASFRGIDLIERAHEEVFAKFNSCVTRYHLAGDSHRALVIADDSSYEKLMQSLLPKWKRQGSRIGRMHSFIEVPLYVNSKASRLVQVADFVAWGTWQYYENRVQTFIQDINGRFDADNGVQHGLVHLQIGHRSCVCVACNSRRTHVIEPIVPVY